MNDIHFDAIGLGKINCDGCDKFLCYGFIEHAFDAGFLCGPCRKKAWMMDAPDKIKDLQRIIKDVKKQLACQNSPEGHDYEDITSQVLCMGITYQCTKCGHTYTKPFQMSWHLTDNDITNIDRIGFKVNCKTTPQDRDKLQHWMESNPT